MIKKEYKKMISTIQILAVKQYLLKFLKYFPMLTLISVFYILSCSTDNMSLIFDAKEDLYTAGTGDDSLNMVPFSGPYTASENYGYISDSAHIQSGPGTGEFVSKIYLFQGTDGLFLFFFHNCDNCNNTNTVKWTIVTKNNNLNDSFVVKDDGNDTYTFTQNPSTGSTEYNISQYYANNSDGGVIGPFFGNSFSITIYIVDPGNITSTLVESASGQTIEVIDEVTIHM